MERLHFGCFNRPVAGWTNTDVTPHLFIARAPGLPWLLHRLGRMGNERYTEHREGVFGRVRYLNVVRRWPYANASFEAIFSSHVLEHLPLHGAKRCLLECHRCLAPGGVLRIAVPDLDAAVAEYQPQDALAWATGLFEADQPSEKNMHHFMYNFDSLRGLLASVGFSDVTRRSYRQGACPDLDRLDNRPASLFVEAVR
jgi:SAM-dependent methyltransferase